MLKITLAQTNPCVGDLGGNAGQIIAAIKQARQNNAGLVIFPELALTGYPPEDLLNKPDFIAKNLYYLEAIRRESKGIAGLLGFVDRSGGKIYNACAYFDNGVKKGVYHKIFLPNYGVFDEKRYFTAGKKPVFWKLNNYKFCVSICEDIWQDGFFTLSKGQRADFAVNISASPFHVGKVSARQKILSRAAKKLKAFLFYCNLSGGQDELVFDGTSMVFSPGGKAVACAKRFAVDTLNFDCDKNTRYPEKIVRRDEREEAFGALKLGLTDYVSKNGFKKVIVGVSGGIDSALVLALAAMALGRENVCGLLMPSKYTSPQTFRDAVRVCENFNVEYRAVNIDCLVNSYAKTLVKIFGDIKINKTEENLQARIRGTLLMAFSNRFGYLVLNTGNKSEVSCGYCTLYGDMVGGFGILKDLPKGLVYKVSRYINERTGGKIPVSIIRRPPSGICDTRSDSQDVCRRRLLRRSNH
jgi:NAD+ synthase (glutamine-hydrolysing)